MTQAATRYDYIVAGAGSAGATLAARLSEHADRSVLLIEDGGMDWSPAIHVPGLLGRLLSSRRLNWNYRGEPDPTLDDRALVWMGGRVIGGSSSINGMVYGRGLPADYARWEAAGNPGWGWNDMLPFFRRMECWNGAPDPARGSEGPLHTRRFEEPNPACVAAMEALVARGVPFVEDYSIGIAEGIGLTQATQRDGRRHSTARAYLAPALRRGNLTLVSRAHVERVIIERGRCIGLDYRRGGRMIRATAERETILCLGAIGSPATLLRSGIGGRETLAAASVPIVHELPGVGRNLNEHVNVKISADVGLPTYNSEGSGFGKAKNAMRWLMTGRGPAASPANHYQAFVKTDRALPTADVQIQIMAFAFHEDMRDNSDGITAVVSLCAPRARGTVSIVSADPAARPRIEIGLLADPADVATLIEGCRIAHAALASEPIERLGGVLVYPPAATRSDAEWLAFIRHTAGINWHPTSTCRMGPGTDDVVDGALRVHGLTGLSVCDASIFPSITSANTNAPVIAVAERAAGIIAARTA